MNTLEVIIPCYNYGHFLAECVDSVLGQACAGVTVVIVNDASPDATPRIADAIASADRRVSVIHHRVNRGHIASYNEALERTTADFTLVLSADDLMTPGSLERAIAAMRAFPRAALCYGDDIPFQTDEVRRAPRLRPAGAGLEFEAYRAFLSRSCAMGHTPIQAPTAVMRMAVQRRLGGFLPELPHTGDTEIWLRLAATGGVVRIDADQAWRRLHARNMSLDYSPVKRLDEQRRAFDHHFLVACEHPGDCGAFREQMLAQIGESAFWIAARAFDEGNQPLFDEALRYATTVYPAVKDSAKYRKLFLKRAMGAKTWAAVQPFLRRALQVRPRAMMGGRS
jgi:glycosyltransferase involved in cell wall biosynthesis